MRRAKIMTIAKLTKLISPDGKNFNVFANLQVKKASNTKARMSDAHCPHLFLLIIAQEEMISSMPNIVPLINEGRLCDLR